MLNPVIYRVPELDKHSARYPRAVWLCATHSCVLGSTQYTKHTHTHILPFHIQSIIHYPGVSDGMWCLFVCVFANAQHIILHIIFELSSRAQNRRADCRHIAHTHHHLPSHPRRLYYMMRMQIHGVFLFSFSSLSLSLSLSRWIVLTASLPFGPSDRSISCARL